MKSKKWIVLTLAAATACGVMTLPLQAAGPAAAPQEVPATRPAEPLSVKPAPAKISPQAQATLDQIRQAYGNLQSLSLAGTVDAKIDVAGQRHDQHATFTSAFKAPNQFRHEVPGEILVGSTGAKAYIYSEKDKQYLQTDAPQEKVSPAKMPPFVAGLLSRQNPSLLMALSKDAAAELIAGAVSVEQSPDEKVGQTSYTALQIQTPQGNEHVLVDPSTHLVKQVKLDLSKMLEQQGAPNVKQAELVFDYSTTQTDAPLNAAQFAWTPPKDAVDASKQPPPQQEAQANELEGKPAPDFTLDNLNGGTQSLSQLKGSVVVLDFWATWCPPCRESLPHLDALYKELSPKGLKVFAVDLQEEKSTVSDYIKKHNLTFPVLLDSTGKVGGLYKANAIPQTVVVAKDGTVKKVFVGFSTEMETQLRQTVEEAMK